MDFALAVVERIGKSIEPDFVITDDNRAVYSKFIQWIHGDPEYMGYLNKGILLLGPTGTGKTLVMQIMSVYRTIDNIKFRHNNNVYNLVYDVVDVNQIISMFVQGGYDTIQSFTTRQALCLDDLGSEKAYAKRFGNSVDAISYIINERYQRKLLTLATTNYPLTAIEERYDDRILSRLYGLFNFHSLKGDDWRKKQSNKITN